MKRPLATIVLAATLGTFGINHASAQEPYIGEVRLFGYNWCPVGWFQAAGQLLAIQQYAALFSLLGTTFGGNGTSTFGLPNLSGRAPYGQLANGQGQPFGAVYGQSQVTLLVQNLPAHTHQLNGSSTNLGTYTPANGLLGTESNTAVKFYAPAGSPPDKPMAQNSIGMTGNNIPISIQSPALSMNWCVAYQGIFPSRP